MIQASWRYKGNLKIQKQPNKWSCLPTAFAICLNIPVSEIIIEVGHDGSEIIFPDKEEPFCRRGFDPQELYRICRKYNYAVTPYDKEIMIDDYRIVDDSVYIQGILQGSVGVLAGVFKDKNTPHAVAWDGSMILDPMDYVYTLEHFEIDVYYILQKILIGEGKHDAFPAEDQESH